MRLSRRYAADVIGIDPFAAHRALPRRCAACPRRCRRCRQRRVFAPGRRGLPRRRALRARSACTSCPARATALWAVTTKPPAASCSALPLRLPPLPACKTGARQNYPQQKDPLSSPKTGKGIFCVLCAALSYIQLHRRQHAQQRARDRVLAGHDALHAVGRHDRQQPLPPADRRARRPAPCRSRWAPGGTGPGSAAPPRP